MGILGSIVKPATALLRCDIPDHLHRGGVRTKPVGYDRKRAAVTLHRALQKLQRSPAIPALGRENLEYFAFVINGPPKIVCLPIDLDKHLVQVPSPPGKRPMLNASFPDLAGEHRTEPVPPKPHCFVADIDTTLEQETL